MGASLFLALLLAGQTYRPTLRDFTFLPIFEKANPKVKYFTELKRMTVAGDQDLVVMLASPEKIGSAGGAPWWSPGALVGVFLQSYAEPPGITTLALLPGSCDCTVRVERARENELLISRTPEYGMARESVKLFFDIHKKKLLSQTSYLPFSFPAIVQRNENPHFIAGDGRKVLVFRPNPEETGFVALSERESQAFGAGAPEDPSVAFGPDRRFQLVQGPDDSFGPQHQIIVEGKRRHPLPQSAPEHLREGIGPHQVWGDKLWFGKTFYDAEGLSGVGGFGYFDAATGAYTIFSPPEIWRWSVSALLVESDAVWLGLMHRGEYGNTTGGLLRWDRITQELKQYPLRSVANAIYQSPNALYVATQDGIAVLRSGRQFFEYYIVDVTARGGYRVVPAF